MSGNSRRAGQQQRLTSIARHGRLRQPSILAALAMFFGVAVAVVAVSALAITTIAAWDLNRQI